MTAITNLNKGGSDAEHGVKDYFDLASEFRSTYGKAACAPHFIGVWDTVSSVGWIDNPLHLPYSADNGDIQIGRHAVAIDERRAFFRNNLWRPRPPDGGPKDLKQVWFPGVHCDIGGGYPEAESGLSKIALEWMFREAVAAGLPVRVGMREAGHGLAEPWLVQVREPVFRQVDEHQCSLREAVRCRHEDGRRDERARAELEAVRRVARREPHRHTDIGMPPVVGRSVHNGQRGRRKRYSQRPVATPLFRLTCSCRNRVFGGRRRSRSRPSGCCSLVAWHDRRGTYVKLWAQPGTNLQLAATTGAATENRRIQMGSRGSRGLRFVDRAQTVTVHANLGQQGFRASDATLRWFNGDGVDCA